jgi:hypothetical protein
MNNGKTLFDDGAENHYNGKEATISIACSALAEFMEVKNRNGAVGSSPSVQVIIIYSRPYTMAAAYLKVYFTALI